jgi:hypothetical protein
MDEDAGEAEILTYRAFRDREALLAWHARRRAHEQEYGVGHAGEDQPRGGEGWFVFRRRGLRTKAH